jgi:hypothetical protein
LQEQATGSPNAAAVAAAAASAGHLPMKPCHRSVRNGVIQVCAPPYYKYPLKILPRAKIHKGTAIVKGTPGVLTTDLRALLGA